ncbi:MAG TPA: Rieske 2Fe-2S domain-containing protein [Vicinamibacteria bacterium]|jgi:nitrite reductase/ring-hydroxylating ferredoxin subunit/multimeric flavodoxin WrbA
MSEARWQEVGPVEELARVPLRQVRVGGVALALSYVDGAFHAVSGACNHAGGPLGEGRLDGAYIVCPWHNWKFHHATGEGEPGFEEDRVPRYQTRVEGGRLLVNLVPATPRSRKPHPPHSLERPVERAPGPIRVVGISTTVMDEANPRFSASDTLLEAALARAREDRGAETQVIRLNELRFRACEGYYSKAARACTWPCSITQMDPGDQLDRVYEALVHWGDVVLVATPIRWGAASSLYFRMAERMNCIQNQVTVQDRVLIRNKVAAFIVVGGQDNVQAVAGQLLGFFAELGFLFPQFPYVAHSRGWEAEDMERNVAFVRESRELREGAAALAGRAVDLAERLLASVAPPAQVSRGGRKAHRMETA